MPTAKQLKKAYAPRAVPTRPKSTKTAEPLFAMQLIVNASNLGHIMAAVEKRTEAIDVKLVKDLHAGKNAPKGAMKAAIIDIIAANKGKVSKQLLTAKLIENGFTKGSIYQAIPKNVKAGVLVRKGEDLMLGKGAK